MPDPGADKNVNWREVFNGGPVEEMWTKKNKKGRKLTEWEVASTKWPQKLYMKTPAAVQEVNKKYPIKKSIYDENGWDRFRNTMSKGWTEFSIWARNHIKPLQFLVNLISPFVPMGPAVQTALQTAVNVADGAVGGKANRDFNLYDILFIYRNSVVALLFKLANDYQVPVDTAQFKKLFHTTPEFKQYLVGPQGGEFVKTLVKAEEAAQKVITNNDQAEVPKTRKEAQQQATELIQKHENQKGPTGEPMVVGKKDMYKWLR